MNLSFLISHLLTAIFPHRCICCDEIIETVAICKNCNSRINWLSTDFFSTFLKDPAWTSAASLAAYDGAWAEMIHNFKYNKRTDLTKHLGGLLAAKVGYEYDLVTCVPLHAKKLRERGYNQSALLAKRAAKMAGFSCQLDLLRRVNYVKRQVGLSQKERVENVKGAFVCERELKNVDILLIDDVMTTGATINECAKALKKKGAGRVDVMTLARTTRT